MALFSKDAPQQPQSRPAPRGNDSQPAFNGTYLGANVTIDGTISGSEAVLIEGTVRGKINLSNELRIGTKARVEATVHAKNVTIEGKLNGDVTADDKVELIATATVDGNIKAPKIIVAEGAKFRGSVDMGRPKDAAHQESYNSKK